MLSKSVSFVPEEPYSFDYKIGYLRERLDQDNRKYVQLEPHVGSDKKSLGLSYARYLYQVHLWKKGYGWIPKDKEVDHINNNPCDDRIENYQLLIHEFNMKKMNSFRGYGAYVVVCMYCGKQYIVKKWSVDEHMNKADTPAMCCSRSCVSSFLGDTVLKGKTLEWVKKHQIQYEIRSHHFEYESWYGNYYPYTEVVSLGSRELLNYTGIDSLRSRLPKDLRYIAEKEFRAPIDRAMLIRDYINEGKSVQVIASFLGLHDTTIYNYITKYNIPVPYREEQSEKILKIESLLKEGFSPAEIAIKLNIHYNTVNHHVKRLGILTKETAKRKFLWENVPRMYFEENRSIKEISKELDVTKRSIETMILRIKNKRSLNSSLIQDVKDMTPLESLLRS